MVGRALADPNPSNSDIGLTQQLAATYADIATRQPVQNATRQALALPRLPDYTARVVPGTQLIEIDVTDISPQRAAAVANELANQLIQLTPTSPGRDSQQQNAFVNSRLQALASQINETETEITKAQQDLANMFSARDIDQTQTTISSLQSKLTMMETNYATLLSTTQRGANNTIDVIEPATPPTAPVGPSKLSLILLGGIIAAVLAVGVAYLLEYLDDTLRTGDDVQKTLGLVTLGTIPEAGGLARAGLAAVDSHEPLASEAYRVLRTNLQFTASVGRPLRSLVITSAESREGKSLTAANLAAALGLAGRSVILIDTALRRPSLHRLYGLSDNVGLTNAVLDSQSNPSRFLQNTSVANVRLMATGPLPPNPSELLASPHMHRILADLRGDADIVILDSPPLRGLADAAILGALADGVVFVICAGKTRRDVARKALARLAQVNARVMGAVLNCVPLRDSEYGASGHEHDLFSSSGSSTGSGHAPSGKPVGAASGVAMATRPGDRASGENDVAVDLPPQEA
jgi:non-specific protein-tyrosine kinase